MNAAEYAVMFQVEDTHWWYVGMRRLSGVILGRPGLPGRVLDAGCGTGGNLAFLGQYGPVTGLDYSPLALEFSRRRPGARLINGSILSLPFAAESFDLVTSFDVIYHRAVPDDQQAVSEVARVLRPGGRLLLRVPAYDWLRGRHDEAVHTRRRYTARDLRQLLVNAGLHPRRLTYANTLLFPLALVKRLLEPRGTAQTASDVGPVPAPLNLAFGLCLALEATWLRWGNLPFGLSVFALAEKPDTTRQPRGETNR